MPRAYRKVTERLTVWRTHNEWAARRGETPPDREYCEATYQVVLALVEADDKLTAHQKWRVRHHKWGKRLVCPIPAGEETVGLIERIRQLVEPLGWQAQVRRVYCRTYGIRAALQCEITREDSRKVVI